MVKKSAQLRPVMTRIPEGLRSKLAREAKRNRTSMNNEIIERLARSFTEDQLARLADAVENLRKPQPLGSIAAQWPMSLSPLSLWNGVPDGVPVGPNA